MTPQENDLLTQVGPATPMGKYMRSHWIPAMRSARLEAGGAPVKSRLLGENFVAFRRTDGQVGFIDEACPHRGVSLALGRNTGEHIQCLFHGWKMDVKGCVAAAPLVPNEEKFCAGVKTREYKVVETGNLIWVYIGGGDAPPFPKIPYTQDAKAVPRAAVVQCNWLQLQEGTLDPNHVAHLHPAWLPKFAIDTMMSAPPTFDMDDTPYGFTGCSIRAVGEEVSYARAKEVILPFCVDIPFDPDLSHTAILSVPIDDETSTLWYVGYADSGLITPEMREMVLVGATNQMSEEDLFWHGVNADPTVPRNYDNFRDSMPYDPANLWGQDRAAMAKGHHTGLPGLVLEDIAVTESMGKLIDRTRETLNVTDAFVTRFRRQLLAAVKAHADGTRPVEFDYSRVIARDGFVPNGRNWRELPRFPDEPKLGEAEDADEAEAKA